MWFSDGSVQLKRNQHNVKYVPQRHIVEMSRDGTF